ncbi:DUF6252 family protein [Nonlabens sp. Asnod2-A12]|uniref:DUF6252 family protein n=1 Tax=Nonlabens sp. Asnod2-A12 TaxID=3160578 RepID=UPI00386FDBC1
MKLICKYLLIALAIISFSSCSDNLEDNNTPAIQAVRNGEFFKADRMSATVNADGTMSIIGQNFLETLEINLQDDSVGVYRLGAGSQSEALYTFNGAEQFSSNLGNGLGEVRITSVNAETGVTGEFSFVSYLASNVDSLYMRTGVIYQVPFGAALGSGAGGSTAATLTANVDGTALNPTAVGAVEAGGTVLVNASNGPSSIVLSFPDTVVPGTYAFDGATYSANYINGGTLDPAVSGSLVVLTADATANTITGTFSFMTGPPNNFDITDGTFNVSY